MTPTRVRLDGIIQICRLFHSRRAGGWVHRANFENSRELSVRGVRVRVICTLHVVPGTGRDIPFQASVTIWPGWKRRLPPKSTGWNSRLSAIGWYKACEQELAQHGYRGKW